MPEGSSEVAIHSQEHNLASREQAIPSPEIKIPRHLIDQLLETAGSLYGGDSSESAYHYDGSPLPNGRKINMDQVKTFPVPTEFASLLFGDDPSQFSIVSFVDREIDAQSAFLEEELLKRHQAKDDKIRSSEVILATHPTRESGRQGIRKEITYKKNDDTYTVSHETHLNEGIQRADSFEWEREKDFTNTISEPYGEMQVEYNLLPDGTTKRTKFYALRNDEGRLIHQGQSVIASYRRSIHIVDKFPDLNFPVYSEGYKQKGADNLGNVGFFVTGDVGDPDKVTVFIGHNIKQWDRPPQTIARSLFRNAEIVLQKGREEWLEFICKDPRYEFLNKRRANKKELVELLNQNIEDLKNTILIPHNIIGVPQELPEQEQLQIK